MDRAGREVGARLPVRGFTRATDHRDDDCPFVQLQMPAYGAVQLVFGICAPSPPGPTNPVTGTFGLQLPQGLVSGTFTGTIRQDEIPEAALFPVTAPSRRASCTASTLSFIPLERRALQNSWGVPS